MPVKQIRLYGDRVLRQVSSSVDEIDDEVKGLAENLAATVDAASGLGLAAPQIGVLKRVIDVVTVDDDGHRSHNIIINPEIVSACGEEVGEEGCLSIPGIYGNVKRPQSVVVCGMDMSGKEIGMEVTGLLARAFAHEIDHLDGILLVDRIGIVKRNLLRGKLNAIRKKAKEISRSLQ